MKMAALLAVSCLAVALMFSMSFAERTGNEVYEKSCSICHKSGFAKAPAYGSNVWLELEKKPGMAVLLENAKKGKNAMPPKGTCDCSDAELKSAIQYMIDSAKPKK